MQYPAVPTLRPLAACLCAAAAMLAYPQSAPAAQRITGGGQVVEERTESHVGNAVTVCVEAAPGVGAGKRAVISHGGTRLTVRTEDADGASCAAFDAADGDVTVRLDYVRLGLVRSRLAVRTYTAAELRGKVLVFRWTRG